MTITGGSALSKDDIDRMVRDAEAARRGGPQRREEAEVRNSAEALVYQTEKFLADNADKVPADAKANVDGPLDELKKALEGNDIEAHQGTATDKVAQASQALGAAIYAQAQQDGHGRRQSGAATPRPRRPTTTSSTPRSSTRTTRSERRRSSRRRVRVTDKRRDRSRVAAQRAPAGDHRLAQRDPLLDGGRSRPAARRRRGQPRCEAEARRARPPTSSGCTPSTPTTASASSATGSSSARRRWAACSPSCCRCSTTSSAPASTASSTALQVRRRVAGGHRRTDWASSGSARPASRSTRTCTRR